MSQRDYERFEVEQALHTIHRAEEHKRDKGLMRHVKKLASAQSQAVASPSKPSAEPKRSEPQKKAPQKGPAPETAARISKSNPMLKGRE